jgi:hypothetical protein
MTTFDIAQLRLHNQRLTRTAFERPEDVVQWLVAIQSQEYAGAKWGVAQRTKGLIDAAIDQAFAEGAILRTHMMRPTWHFVTPVDIRWMLKLTAPHVHAANAYYYRKLGLDDSVFAQSNALLTKALQGGKQHTRSELESILQQAGVTKETDDRLRIAYIMMHAELDAVICSGALRGKQHTYALLDERAPQAISLGHDEARAELARCYFTSRGPATLKDYMGWSGLSAVDAKAGLDAINSQLAQEVVDGKTYWFPQNMPTEKTASPTAWLLPAYDEYFSSYKDHTAVLEPEYSEQVSQSSGQAIILDGKIVGVWKRTFTKKTVIITPTLFAPLNDAESQALAEAEHRYGEFI